jgi:hypothetical protein
MMPGPAAGEALHRDTVRRIAQPGTPRFPPVLCARPDAAEAEYLEDVGRPGEGSAPRGAASAPPVPRAA